jgi:hypothetical protein
MKKVIFPAVILALLCACATNSPQGLVPSECTASKSIWYEFIEAIPSHLSNQQAREAVMVSLQNSGVRPTSISQSFPGEWRYEYHKGGAIYAGLTVRSHYLRTAITLDADTVRSIVCDSRNLGQGRWTIHRNVPTWKAVLDDNIRIAMRQAAEYHEDRPIEVSNDNVSLQMNYLDALFESGILTRKEYQEMKQRVTDSGRTDQ